MTQLMEEHYFTKGRVIVRGKSVTRGKAKKADYILFYKPNLPIAVVEAKDNNHPVGAGMQQALEYAAALDLPFAYSSNGDAFLEHDRTRTQGSVEREISLDAFPTPAELWGRYLEFKQIIGRGTRINEDSARSGIEDQAQAFKATNAPVIAKGRERRW